MMAAHLTITNVCAPSHLGQAASIPIATFMARLGTECNV
jgi:hypothetical protein